MIQCMHACVRGLLDQTTHIMTNQVNTTFVKETLLIMPKFLQTLISMCLERHEDEVVMVTEEEHV